MKRLLMLAAACVPPALFAANNLLDRLTVSYTGSCLYGEGDLLDGNYTARWLMYGPASSYDNKGVLMITQDIVEPVNSYQIWVGGELGRCPTAWTFWGSADGGATWTKLDEQSGVSGWVLGASGSKTFNFVNSTRYSKFKFVVTAPNQSLINMSELAFYSNKDPDWVEVVSSSGDYEGPVPSYGLITGKEQGDEITLSYTKDTYVELETSHRHELLGFSLADENGETLATHALSECPFTYTHPGAYRRLTWNWHDQFAGCLKTHLSESVIVGIDTANLTFANENGYGNEGNGKNLFGKSSGRWLCASTPCSASVFSSVDLPVVRAYSVKAHGSDSASRTPTVWTLYGSNDGGATWDVVDARTTTANWTKGEERYFYLNNSVAYNAFKFAVTMNQSGTGLVELDVLHLYSFHPSADMLEIVGSPKAYGTASPAYGFETNLAASAALTLTAPAETISVSDGERAACSGYILASDSGRSESGSSKVIAYVHDGSYTKLTWVWSTEYKVAPAVSGDGSVAIDGESVAAKWVQGGENVTLAATPGTGSAFAYWAGADAPADAARTSPEITLTADKVLDIRAVFASVLYVDQSVGSDDNRGQSWELPLATVAKALEKVGGIGTVMVKPGTYVNATADALAATGEVRLVAHGRRDAVVLRACADGGRVLAVADSALVSGFTIAGGKVGTSECGGGVYATGGVVSNCCIAACSAGTGGGLYAYGDSALLVDSVVTNCSASFNGGGVSLGLAKRLDVVRTRIAGCRAGNQGGGAASYYGDGNSSLTLRQCTVTGCSGSSLGGAVHLDNGSRAYDCLVAGNTNLATSATGINVGTVYVRGSRLFNCTFADNVVSDAMSGGVRVDDGTFYNCIFCGTKLTDGSAASNLIHVSGGYCCSCLSEDAAWAVGADARSLLGSPMLRRDYTLRPTSPCVNAGTNSVAGVFAYAATDVDLKGNPRIYRFGDEKRGFVDMGCFELQQNAGVPGMMMYFR